ncbi:MAG: hypothetical protein GC166_00565 [Alphaproteobacteria bacterium]|nr:hypothetical protein [Alphaproteobacteria bacterium]
MKLFLHGRSLERVRPALEATGLDLDIYALEGEQVRHGSERIAPDSFDPDIIWITLDAFAARELGPFFKAALTGKSKKWVQTFNAGLDLPVFRQIFDRGVTMSNSNAQAVPIAEFVIARVSGAWYPHVTWCDEQTAHRWTRVPFRELAGSRWLIFGYGNIAREIAKRVKAFGAHVTGIRRSGGSDDFADVMDVPANLLKHLPNADVVVLASGLNAETHHVANANFFAAMKTGSILVNIGRGGLVDEPALLAALENDAPGVAILDVFETEPLPADSPFWDHPKVRMSAHTSPTSDGIIARGDRLFLDNLVRYAKGEPLINAVTERTF